MRATVLFVLSVLCSSCVSSKSEAFRRWQDNWDQVDSENVGKQQGALDGQNSVGPLVGGGIASTVWGRITAADHRHYRT